MSSVTPPTQVVERHPKVEHRRAEIAKVWDTHEAVLLEKAVETFRMHCTRAADLEKPQVTVSFEALTREIPDFPKRVLKDVIYYADNWPDGITAEAWFYSNNGTHMPYEGIPILFAELLDRMITKFLKKVQSLAFPSCKREEGTWKVTAMWGGSDTDEHSCNRAKDASFSEQLKAVLLDKQEEKCRRAQSAAAWEVHEAMLLDRAVSVFRKRCTQAAEAQKAQMTVSFESLSREVFAFPTRVLRGATYYVDEWGDGVLAESWFYACKGTESAYSGSAILFSEVLDRMLTKFLFKVQAFGFSSCHREAGTWRLIAIWDAPAQDQRESGRAEGVSFAAHLKYVMLEKQREQSQRAEKALAWEVHESLLLDRTLALFQKKCMLAAERKQDQATVSFEALTRCISDFPTRIHTGETYYVDQWPESITAASWFFAQNGTKQCYNGSPIRYAEMLERMITRFMERAQSMGFASCMRDASSWDVTAVWGTHTKDERLSKRVGEPLEEEPLTKKARQAIRVGGA